MDEQVALPQGRGLLEQHSARFLLFLQLIETKEAEYMAQILIADDDALIGEVVFHTLEQNGHQVSVIDNGADVVDAILRTSPDIVILDNLMPGLLGLEILAELKIRDATADIPVIMLTAQTGMNHMIEAYQAGVSDYMTKPFEPGHLITRIAGMVGDDRNLPHAGISLQ